MSFYEKIWWIVRRKQDNQSHLIMSGPVLSRRFIWVHSRLFFTTSSYWPGILHVIFPHTTHSYITTSSYLDQIVYTLSPSVPPPLFNSERYFEGPDVTTRPGLKPSTSLQVGKTDFPWQLVSPRFPPAIPTKVFILLLRDYPTLYVPSAWSYAFPPLMILRASVTPIEWVTMLTWGASV